MSTALSRSGICGRRYGGPGGRGSEAVPGVTFLVRRGELFSVLPGTNGAGKTSTMEVL